METANKGSTRRRWWPAIVPAAALALCEFDVGCGSDDGGGGGAGGGGPFTSFEPAAKDPNTFTEPRDAVPLDNGAIAFIARAPGSAVRDEENAAEDGTTAQISDRFAVFMVDAPNAPAHLIYDGLVAPFNIASNGKDQLWVADIGGGASGQGAIVQIGTSGGNATLLAEGFQPQGVTTDKDGKVFFTGRDPASGDPGVFALSGASGTPIATGGQFRSPSGLDVADDGAIFVADSSAATDLEDDVVKGAGQGAVFKVVGASVSVVAAGFDAGYPTGIAVTAAGKIAISAYEDRGTHSAVYIFDPNAPAAKPVVYTDKLTDVFQSAGLHRNRAKGNMTWAGGDAVYQIIP